MVIGLQHCASINTFKLPQELEEVSGLAIQDEQQYWWHNDGGHPPNLYLTDANGDISKITTLSLANHDWEDITIDDQGRLYIGDFGNNRNDDSPLNIHRYDPEFGETQTIQFQYTRSDIETQENRGIDCEAMFWYQGQLYLFTKAPPKSKTFDSHLFILDGEGESQLTRWFGKFHFKKRIITGGAIHQPSGKVALVSYRYGKLLGVLPWSHASVWSTTIHQLLEEPSPPFKERRFAYLFAKQYESIDFLNEDEVLVASEKTLFFKPKVRKLVLKK